MMVDIGTPFPLRFTAEQLETVTADLLKPMSRLWGGKGNEPKAECIRRIVAGLADVNAVRTALSVLTPEDRGALAILKEYGGVMQVGLLDDLLRVYGYTGAERPTISYGFMGETSYYVADLLRRGYLLLAPRYAPYSPYGNLRFGGLHKGEFVYIDERFLRQIDWPVEVRPLSLAPAPYAPPAPNVRSPQLVLLDLLAVTRTLAEMKGLSLTKTQSIRTSDLRQLAKRLGWSETRTIDGYSFPSMIHAVISAWYRAGWLGREEDEDVLSLTITPEGFARQPLSEQVRKLLNGFISLQDWSELPTIPAYSLQNIFLARYSFVHSLRALPDSTRYYTVPDLMAALYDRLGGTISTQYDYRHLKPQKIRMTDQEYEQALAAWRTAHRAAWIERETPFCEAVLTSWLYWLGIVEVGRLADARLVFRLTELGRILIARDIKAPVPDNARTSDHLAWIVQPNYDIVVYLDAVSQAQLAFLEGHAERRQSEAHTAHYQLTRESVYRGLEGGATIEEVLATLRNGAKTALPQNVERELREWAGQREQIAIRTKARLISFPSSETRGLALEAGLKGTPVGETYVIVEEGAQIKAALKAVFGMQSIPAIDYGQAPGKCLRVVEDGTLTIAVETVDLLLRGQLARCAEPLSATQWRITPASLATVRQAGVSAGTLLAFLQSRVHGTVPALLEILIGNALGTRDVVQAETAYLLRVTNKKLYTAITTSPLLKPFLLDVPGPDTIAVRMDRVEAFKAKFDWLGIKLVPFAPIDDRPDWQQTLRDAKTQQRRRARY